MPIKIMVTDYSVIGDHRICGRISFYVVSMFNDSCLYLSFRLADVSSLTIIAIQFMYHILFAKIWKWIFMCLDDIS